MRLAVVLRSGVLVVPGRGLVLALAAHRLVRQESLISRMRVAHQSVEDMLAGKTAAEFGRGFSKARFLRWHSSGFWHPTGTLVWLGEVVSDDTDTAAAVDRLIRAMYCGSCSQLAVFATGPESDLVAWRMRRLPYTPVSSVPREYSRMLCPMVSMHAGSRPTAGHPVAIATRRH